MPLGEPVSVAESDELWVLEAPSVYVDPKAFVVDVEDVLVDVEDVVVGVEDVVIDVEDVVVDVVADVVSYNVVSYNSEH